MLKKILKDKYLRIVFGISFFVFLIASVFAAAKFWDAAGPLIIHFDAFKGIDWVGSRIDVFGIFISALVMFLINVFLANFIYERERFLSYLFSFASLVLSILFLAAIITINSVNF